MHNFYLFTCSFLTSLTIASLDAHAVQATGNEDGESVQTALSLLRSGNPTQIDRAITSIVRLGPRAASAVPMLIELLSDERFIDEHALVPEGPPSVQLRAAEGLQAIGKAAVEPLTVRLAESADDEMTILIIKTLGEIGPDANAAAELLLKCAASSDSDTRMFAIDAFAKVGRDSRIVVPKLLHSLDDEDPNVRSVAVQALARIAPQAALAIPKLVAMLDSHDYRTEYYTPDSAGAVDLRVDVADCLAKIGVRDEQAVAKLTLLLKHDDPYVRIAAAHAHCKLSEDVNTGLAVLSQALNDRSHGDRIVYKAAEALADLGKCARPLARQLISLLHDDEVLVRCAAVRAVASVQPPDFFDLLVRCAQDEHELVKMAAVQSVASLASRDSPIDKPTIVAVLIKGLDDGAWLVRVSAMNGLGRFGQDAREALPRLRELAASKDAWDRQEAKSVIEQIEGHE